MLEPGYAAFFARGGRGIFAVYLFDFYMILLIFLWTILPPLVLLKKPTILNLILLITILHLILLITLL